jgi:hypothetical protein
MSENHVPKVGDVYATSWGYDQTNVEFYQITKVSPSGKTVSAQEIGQEIRGTDGEPIDVESRFYGARAGTGRVFPRVDAFVEPRYYDDGRQIGRAVVTNKRITPSGSFRVTSGSGWGVFAHYYDLDADEGRYETFAAGGLGH